MEEKVVLVNKNNEVLGLMPKVEAHEKGLLHRAISILLYNSKGEMLIQQRAKTKYHWPLIWSNAVCSHPRENEDFQDAAQRRLKEELNITCSLKEVYRFIYKAKDEQTGLIEHEYDVVYEGQFDGEIPFNPNEIESIRWIALSSLSQDIEDQPEIYSFWFKEILKNVR
ncbi:MAG: isopentenyl-diphosphate Delta-isomerase [Chitinophagales bacterium]|jgi:isopentenyl-diphosphate delta-isomerase|nr:isopentenyl-diphosphate Delta-isomerase [Sphingobacteriales bacterium]